MRKIDSTGISTTFGLTEIASPEHGRGQILHENCRSSEAKDTRHGWTRFFFQLIKPKEITVYSFAWFSKNQDQTRQAKKNTTSCRASHDVPKTPAARRAAAAPQLGPSNVSGSPGFCLDGSLQGQGPPQTFVAAVDVLLLRQKSLWNIARMNCIPSP